MQRTFTINGKTYTAAPFNFNLVCDMEEMGVSLDSMKKMPMSAVRAYFALCLGGDRERAGKEIEAHLMTGEDLTPIIDAMTEEMNESDFFRALSTNKGEEVAKDQGKEGKESK